MKAQVDTWELIERTGSLNDEQKQKLEEYRQKIEEFETQIKELDDLQVQIDIEIASNPSDLIYTNMQSIVGDLITDTDQLISATEAIGEGWKVAAEDVAQFAAAFPELLENANLALDGSIELDHQLTNSYLENRKKMMEADAEVTINALQQKIDQTEAEIKF